MYKIHYLALDTTKLGVNKIRYIHFFGYCTGSVKVTSQAALEVIVNINLLFLKALANKLFQSCL